MRAGAGVERLGQIRELPQIANPASHTPTALLDLGGPLALVAALAFDPYLVREEAIDGLVDELVAPGVTQHPMPLNLAGELVPPISPCCGQRLIRVAQKLVVLVEFPVQAGIKRAVQAEVLRREQLVDPQVARGGEFGYRK